MAEPDRRPPLRTCATGGVTRGRCGVAATLAATTLPATRYPQRGIAPARTTRVAYGDTWAVTTSGSRAGCAVGGMIAAASANTPVR